MDIWAWVHEQERALSQSGERSLSRAMDAISHHTVNDEHAQVDALLPEALARARALNLPWVEVYLRHWSLQSRVFHRQDAHALSEAVSLVERSHRADARDCPQSVCTVQDLAAAYALVDGPAYAEERMAVARETLARIDPRWPCFSCITGELATALDDAEQPAQALALVEAGVAAMRAARVPRAEAGLSATRVRCLLRMERFEDALTELASDERRGRDDAFSALRRRNNRALSACRLGRIEAALEAFPSPDEMEGSPGNYREWIEAAAALCRASALDFPGPIALTMGRFADVLERGGGHRNAFEVRTLHAELCLETGLVFAGERSVARLADILPRLVKPLGADATFARLSAAAERARAERTAAGAHALPETPDEVVARLQACGVPDEATFDLLEGAALRFPDHPGLAAARAGLWDLAGFGADAVAHLRGVFERQPANFELTLTLAGLLYGLNDDAGLAWLTDRLADRASAAEVDADTASLGTWFQAQRARDRGELEEALRLAESVYSAGVRGPNLLTLLAETALALGRPSVARRYAEDLEALVPGDRNAAWLTIMAATWLREWAAVRTAGARLGLRFVADEGPVDEIWGACRVRCDTVDGPRDLFGVRRGPALVELLDIARNGEHPQRGDRLVIRPTPQNEGPPEGDTEAAECHLWTYIGLGTVVEGHFWSFTLDGPAPGSERWEAFRAALRMRGGDAHVYSGEGYVCHPPGSPPEAGLPALFGRAALPPTETPAAALALFDEHFGASAGAPRPFVPELAHLAGEPDRARSELALGEAAGVDFREP